LDSSIITALLRDPVVNRLTGSLAAEAKKELPETIVARVTALRGEVAKLHWQGGIFLASLSASVIPGETLLLKYSGIRQERSHYRIMARFPAGTESVEGRPREASEPFLFGLLLQSPGGQEDIPALARFLPSCKQGEDPSGGPDPILELFIDTESFGLVLIRFYYYRDNRLECRFIVESREAGEALEHEAECLVTEQTGLKDNQDRAALKWVVGDLRQFTAQVLHQGGLNLNRKA
jgi:hypothetical protein